MNAQPTAPTQSKLPVVLVVILVLLALCIVIPVCVIVILALLGPAIGNVFSNIIVNMTPVP
jgi:hypothetical protein